MNYPNNKSRNYCNNNNCEPCGTYVTIQGPPRPAGPQGLREEQGSRGEQGEQGIQEPKEDTGEAPAITVVEDTPLSYKLNFKTSADDITTPNLFKPLVEYPADLSASRSTLNIPLRNLILTYQQTSATTIRISVIAKDQAVPVLTDMLRTAIYNSSSVETTSVWVQWSEIDVSYEAPEP